MAHMKSQLAIEALERGIQFEKSERVRKVMEYVVADNKSAAGN